MRLVALRLTVYAVCLVSIPCYADTSYFVNIGQDTDVISGTQWTGENKSNQGANPEIEPIRANDGYDTRHVVYLGFDFSSNNNLKSALSQGDKIDSFKLFAYNTRNFAQGDAAVGDVVTNIYYVNNDNWKEGIYSNWTVIDSSDPLSGMTYSNQVGYNEHLATENEDAANKWYGWEFSAKDFSPGGINDSLDYLSLAMVPNSLDKSSSWWLVSSFASKENSSGLHPYLQVNTVPEPINSILFLIGGGVFTLARKHRVKENNGVILQRGTLVKIG